MTAPSSSAVPYSVDALRREKLTFLLEEQALAYDSAQKFSLKKQIEDLRRVIAESEGLDGDVLRPADDATDDGEAGVPPGLKTWTPPALPALPYPVLLPYSHPKLLAGREQDLVRLRRLLRTKVPILGLSALSGTGKSSLLLGALVPALRSAGRPVAYSRHPHEPGVARRLLGDLLDAGAEVDDGDWRAFVERLADVERLAGEPPLLVLDQFEDVLREPAGRTARAVLGPLLAATAERRPGSDRPRCRWLLAYREEFHGEAHAWLGDVLRDAGGDVEALPRDLSRPERFHSLALQPLGTASAGRDALAEATRVFQLAIERPLELTSADGRPVYPWRFAPGQAERLARAFAEARRARPDAPLTPELQVVLAYLMRRAPSRVLEVDDDTAGLVEEALEDHLRRALDRAFPSPSASGVPTDRARALLALRELATPEARRGGLRADDLAKAMGAAEGDEILEKLATPLTRLIVAHNAGDGRRYTLSHDQMAEVVVRVVEDEDRRGKLLVDGELLALRSVVALKTALFRSHPEQATRLPRGSFRNLAEHGEALLWDDERRDWWAACRRRRRGDRWRTALGAMGALLLVAGVASVVWILARQRIHDALLKQLVTETPEAALKALSDLDVEDDLILASLRRRDHPLDMLETLDALDGEERDSTVLRTVEIALPLVEEAPDDPMLVARLAMALDFAPSRNPALAEKAQELRARVLGPLRKSRPPPSLVVADWSDVQAGTFHREGYDVTVSAFRMLRHEVTNAEYRRLVPGHAPGAADDVPAANVSWYEAYTYAAWLGGRLPTEAEWEYAERAGCVYAYCRQDGSEATVGEVAWIVESSRARPVMGLEPNPWGLYDMLGNLREWTADGYGEYREEAVSDPWSPSGGRRVVRGGSFGNVAVWARFAFRFRFTPDFADDGLGFRVVLPPGRPEP